MIFGLFFAGLFILSLGIGITLFKGQISNDDIQIISASPTGGTGEIVVHVDGAVAAPGVYKLTTDSRIGDAIKAAGGFAKDADTAKVNLAAKIADGQKILIPKKGEADVKGLSLDGGLININTASEKELDTLPGIGPVTAQKIIASRPYSDSGELLSKKVVSGSVYEKIKGLITVF
ncbi:ComEA family DNA-binding protein [Candidatus Curtissbacteria bacterium]|nr:ComEA family DNA-binding protein [Candidatus Curtissbacteria bacterium]